MAKNKSKRKKNSKSWSNLWTPDKGDRKVRITLIFTFSFLIIVAASIFIFHAQIADTLKVLAEFLKNMIFIFTGGNAVEHISDSFGKRKEITLNTPNDDEPPVTPSPPIQGFARLPELPVAPSDNFKDSLEN